MVLRNLLGFYPFVKTECMVMVILNIQRFLFFLFLVFILYAASSNLIPSSGKVAAA